MNHASEHLLSTSLVLAVLLLAACAPAAPMTDNVALSLFQGGTQAGLMRPEFVAVSGETAISAWPIASGNGSGPTVWGVACANGNCPALPGTAMTGAALSKFFNDLAAYGYQIYSRASAFAGATSITPLVLPVSPAMLEQMPVRVVD